MDTDSVKQDIIDLSDSLDFEIFAIDFGTRQLFIKNSTDEIAKDIQDELKKISKDFLVSQVIFKD